MVPDFVANYNPQVLQIPLMGKIRSSPRKALTIKI